jgi:hypothetical protein
VRECLCRGWSWCDAPGIVVPARRTIYFSTFFNMSRVVDWDQQQLTVIPSDTNLRIGDLKERLRSLHAYPSPPNVPSRKAGWVAAVNAAHGHAITETVGETERKVERKVETLQEASGAFSQAQMEQLGLMFARVAASVAPATAPATAPVPAPALATALAHEPESVLASILAVMVDSAAERKNAQPIHRSGKGVYMYLPDGRTVFVSRTLQGSLAQGQGGYWTTALKLVGGKAAQALRTERKGATQDDFQALQVAVYAGESVSKIVNVLAVYHQVMRLIAEDREGLVSSQVVKKTADLGVERVAVLRDFVAMGPLAEALDTPNPEPVGKHLFRMLSMIFRKRFVDWPSTYEAWQFEWVQENMREYRR